LKKWADLVLIGGNLEPFVGHLGNGFSVTQWQAEAFMVNSQDI
jgi:hypothetical protein